jgi:hypothetical protein
MKAQKRIWTLNHLRGTAEEVSETPSFKAVWEFALVTRPL